MSEILVLNVSVNVKVTRQLAVDISLTSCQCQNRPCYAGFDLVKRHHQMSNMLSIDTIYNTMVL